MLLQALGLILGTAASLFPSANAQSTNVTCSQTYIWADNSLGQSPCLVAAYLQSVCNGGTFEIAALAPDYHYLGPTLANANQCQCSTVTYSLVSACADCQGAQYEIWSQWSFNCSTVYETIYPFNIPPGTAVPAWAYLNVIQNNTYSSTQAISDLGQPESTGVPPSTATALPSTTASSPTPSAAPVPAHKSSNAGAIAGGVVGGIVALALIAGAVLCLRNRRSRPAPLLQEDQNVSQPPMRQFPNSFDSTSSYPTPPPKLYDPSDPSTYPTTEVNSMPSGYVPSLLPNGVSEMPSGQYTGVAEL